MKSYLGGARPGDAAKVLRDPGTEEGAGLAHIESWAVGALYHVKSVHRRTSEVIRDGASEPRVEDTERVLRCCVSTGTTGTRETP